MNLFPLLIVLPSDIVYYIYKILKEEKAVNIIVNFYKYKKKRINVLLDIINRSFSDEDSIFIKNSNVNNLNFILNNNYPKTYNLTFWQHILNIMSTKIMTTYIRLIVNRLNYNKNNYYLNFKKIYNLWFKICGKFKVKLYTTIRLKNTTINTITYSHHIKKIHDYSKYLYTPRIFVMNEIVTDIESKTFINNTINNTV